MLPLEGRILDGKFRFVRMLGEGGMGAVWRAENVLVKKTVAIKLMHIQFSKDEGVLARFRNEATAAGRIGSEHICDILDLGRSDLGPYIVMEMLRGRDLSGFLQHRQGKVDPGLSVLIVREALKGLGAAHQVGIVHRDLKPENIFLHEPKPGELMVKLMDFGISKFTEGSEAGKTGIGVLMGTPEYMSPEQTEGAAQVDHRTDIWAMGVILYWALSGRNPFLGPTLAATLVNVSTKQPPPLTSLGSHIHPDLVAVIDRCIRKNPAERWASCDEMAAALAPFEDRNNGVYVLSGASASAPSGPGRTMASATPPPGATVAGSPSGMAGTAPTMAGAMTGAGVANPGTGPGTGPVAGAAPTFMGAAPSGVPGGGGNSPTWSNEFKGTAGAAPTLGGESTFGLGADHLERRPDSSLGSGSKVGMIVIVIALLAALGGGGWFAYQKFGGGTQGGEVAAGEDDDGAADGKAAGDGKAAADGTPAEDDAAADAGEAESGTGAVVAGGSDATSTGSAEESGSTGGDAADDPGDTGTATTTGAAEVGTTAAADDGGADEGGGTDPKPPTNTKPDLTKVRKSGSLYGLKRGKDARTFKSAKGTCGSLRKKKFANLKKWRVPSSASELKKFSGKAGKGKYWINDGRIYSTATGNVGKPLRGVQGGRVLCVSS